MVAQRTWQHVLDEIITLKSGPTLYRWQTASRDKAFDLIRSRLLIETQAEHLLEVLKKGTVSTNAYLRKTHNFALDMNWLPATVFPRRQWPAIHFKEKRAITLADHQKIVAAEVNLERRTLYQLCWHLGASQGDIAALKGEDVDWANNTVSFFRKKTGVPVLVDLGSDALNLLKDLPSEGPIFPYLSKVRAGDRATEFKQSCHQLKIHGVALNSYRYAWAERAKTAGYPERFAQEALGHNSKAVHRAYAKRALVKNPPWKITKSEPSRQPRRQSEAPLRIAKRCNEIDSRNDTTKKEKAGFGFLGPRHGISNGSAVIAVASARAHNFTSKVYSGRSGSHDGLLCGETNMPQGS
jgi:integrase